MSTTPINEILHDNAIKDITVHHEFHVVSQYIKDVSFETPGAWTFANQEQSPEIEIGLEVSASHVNNGLYEVELQINAHATYNEESVFVLELLYAGLFEIGEISEEKKEALLFIACPNLIFPFARKIVNDLTQEGGFPPLSLSPVDFKKLYLEREEK